MIAQNAQLMTCNRMCHVFFKASLATRLPPTRGARGRVGATLCIGDPRSGSELDRWPNSCRGRYRSAICLPLFVN